MQSLGQSCFRGVRRMMNNEYMMQWGKRPDQVDCRNCCGDETGVINRLNCGQCAGTGLDPIPWNELFTRGRKLGWNEWRGLK